MVTPEQYAKMSPADKLASSVLGSHVAPRVRRGLGTPSSKDYWHFTRDGEPVYIHKRSGRPTV